MEYIAGNYDVAVIGAGHAGIEAALASARLGCSTAIFTINMDAVGNCPCNPSIGGTAKGHLVREIDALGGEMGKTADECFLQMRMLNRGKGPAVHSLRAQIDRRKYSDVMKHKLELQENLHLRQAEIVDIKQSENGWILKTRMNALFEVKAVIIATGTYLGGRIFIGEVNYESGPDGTFPATFLGQSLKDLGLPLRRFKTGTPARVNKRSIDFSVLEVQPGDEETAPFSFMTEEQPKNILPCHISYTNLETHKVIKDNIHRSPLYGGKIEGIGPRYCPSIEDKVMRFADKERHQLFIEPCGLNTDEMYIQGMSSSLPEDVQVAMYRSVKGMENAQIVRNAYAIEYDCINPMQLKASLEFKKISGLFSGGQFNGSSGYEEAAAQGLIAGMNAHLKVAGKDPFILKRDQAYIGVLIDDLITKGVDEPYRMFTSRAEYRTLLRQDNADIRLTPISYEAGLADKFRYDYTMRKYDTASEMIEFFDKTPLKPDVVNSYLESVSSSTVDSRKRISDLVSRPQVKLVDIFNMVPRGTFMKNNIDIDSAFASPLSGLLSDEVNYSDLLKYGSYDSLATQFSDKSDISYKDAAYVLKFNTEYPVSDLDSSFMNEKVDSNYRREILDSCEIAIKYKGYIQREQQMADKIMRLENLTIPEDFDFDRVESLSIECRQKLKKYAPRTIAQASRISGISPADVSVLLVYFGR